MPYTTLVSAADLADHLNDPDWAVVDCRFSLADPAAGRRSYMDHHIPGAVYAHLDDDLSGPAISGKTGRHPLPEPDRFAEMLSAWGIDAGTQVIAYDDKGGAVAARMWWLMRWMGHEAAAVLDGGWTVWQQAGYPVTSGPEHRPAARYTARPQGGLIASLDDVEAAGSGTDAPLLDARSPERYRGEEEPIDPVAGHIPGAVSVPFAGNLDADGRFLSPEALRERFQAHLGDAAADRAICYCGSGVTANHNVLAMAHAGIGLPRLYPGSWSEWITDPNRPVATGDPESP